MYHRLRGAVLPWPVCMLPSTHPSLVQAEDLSWHTKGSAQEFHFTSQILHVMSKPCSARRDMTQKRFKHLHWREKRPPMLPFESYVLLEKLEGALESKDGPEITNITASAVPSAAAICEAVPKEN